MKKWVVETSEDVDLPSGKVEVSVGGNPITIHVLGLQSGEWSDRAGDGAVFNMGSNGTTVAMAGVKDGDTNLEEEDFKKVVDHIVMTDPDLGDESHLYSLQDGKPAL